jgi:hypothetical protein
MEFINRLARSVVTTPLLWNALTCKHSAYQHEAEIRMIILGEKKQFKGKVSTRLRNGKAVRYIARGLPLRKRGYITEIVIGPAAPKSAEATIRRALKLAGVNHTIPLRRSRLPYRSFKLAP